jgi:hypothetical protein
VGKTRVLDEILREHPMVFVPASGCLGDVVAAVEPALGLERGDLRLAPRVHRTLAALARQGRPVVFDNVRRVPPKVAHFIRVLMSRQPVWLVARSALPMQLGHVWPYLFLYEKIEVPPFTPAESRAFLAAVPYAGAREELTDAASRLHRLAAGHPATLRALVTEMHAHRHDLSTAEGLRLLATHTRISEVEAHLAMYEPGA